MKIGMIMDAEKKKMSDMIYNEISTQNIPAELMIYIMMSVIADLRDMTSGEIALESAEEEERKMQETAKQEEGEEDGRHKTIHGSNS